MSNMMIIETQLIKDRLKDFEGNLYEKVLFAMKEARRGVSGLANFSDDEKFRIAVAAVIISSEGEDKERLEWESKCIRAISSTMKGIPVNAVSVLEEGTSQGWKPLGLISMWNEGKQNV